MGFSISKISMMIEKFLRDKKIRRRYLVVLMSLALVVAMATVGALKLTGVTKTHGLTVVDCPLHIHDHDDGCYDRAGNLICGYADFVVHSHSADCYTDGVLTCELPVIKVHEHTDKCYLREKYLVNDIPADETDSALEVVAGSFYKVRETLTCEKNEIILHTHTDECFEEAVFDENGRMVSLTSRLPEGAVIPDTWTNGKVPACGQLEINEHTHGAGCMDTIKLSAAEAKVYISTLKTYNANAGDNSDGWSGLKKSEYCKDIGNEDESKTVKEQLAWSVTINFPDDETWTEFTYTDSFTQTITGWILHENNEVLWEENYPIHHYQTLSELEKELDSSLSIRLSGGDLENDLTYSFVFIGKDGKEAMDDDAQVVAFEIHFVREAGENLSGHSVNFNYTTLLNTDNLVDKSDYSIGGDFTLPGFTGHGNCNFRYTDAVLSEFEIGDISVKQVWRDVEGGLLTDDIPSEVKIMLKRYAVKGGIYLTEKPEDPENWCELTMHISHGDGENQNDVLIKSLSGEELGTNVFTVWIPQNALVQLNAEESADDSAPWSYTFDLTDVYSCELTVTVNDDSDCITLNVIGKAPAGFVPSGDYTVYDEIILSAGNRWKYIWEELPMNDGNGTQYVYVIEEVAVPDGFFAKVEDDGNGSFTITNRKLMEPGKITVDIRWIDTDGIPLVKHPGQIDLELQKKVYKSPSSEYDADYEWVTVENSKITLPDDNGKWTAVWTDLEEGEYRVAQKDPGGNFVTFFNYVVYDNEGNRSANSEALPGNAGFVSIANIEVLAKDGEIVIVKIWEYDDGTPDPDHPDSVTIVIKRAKKSSGPSDTTTETTTTVPNTTTPTTTTTPNTSTPNTTTPNTSTPNTSTPDTSVPNTSVPDTSTPGTTTPVTTTPDTYEPPVTGDEAHLNLYIILMVFSGGFLMIAVLYNFAKRAEKRKK